METCRLCGNNTRLLFCQRVLFKHDVTYWACPTCELIQSQKPFWLEEAYGSAMSRFDTGAIARNALCAQLTSVIARLVGLTPQSRCADFGGGHGVFVRMMRDKGLDFRLCDKYAQNLFARGFDADPTESFDLLSSFEVLEHFPDPAADLTRMFAPRHRCILAGTVLHRGHREGWWYYSPQSGQHVAFYSRKTMGFIGALFGYDALCGPAYTLFVRKDQPLTTVRRRVLQKLLRDTRPNRNPRWLLGLAAVMPRYTPLIESDNATLLREAA